MSKIPKMRLISECYQLLKEKDPNTAITLCGLRRLVNSGAIPSVKVGKKALIDYEQLLDYLSNPPTEKSENDSITNIGTVRPIY